MSQPLQMDLPPELDRHLRWLLDPQTTSKPNPTGRCIACRRLQGLGWIVKDESGEWTALNVWEMV